MKKGGGGEKMSEIMFRGKRLRDNKWIYGAGVKRHRDKVFLIDASNTVLSLAFNIATLVRVNPETVGRYIGIVDDNGDKIFVGDIIRAGTERYTICECQGGCIGRLYVEKFPASCYPHIVGNIYDNTELLDWSKP
jgi:uncharacterized phage protein (TIGR01671 family)